MSFSLVAYILATLLLGCTLFIKYLIKKKHPAIMWVTFALFCIPFAAGIVDQENNRLREVEKEERDEERHEEIKQSISGLTDSTGKGLDKISTGIDEIKKQIDTTFADPKERSGSQDKPPMEKPIIDFTGNITIKKLGQIKYNVRVEFEIINKFPAFDITIKVFNVVKYGDSYVLDSDVIGPQLSESDIMTPEKKIHADYISLINPMPLSNENFYIFKITYKNNDGIPMEPRRIILSGGLNENGEIKMRTAFRHDYNKIKELMMKSKRW